MSGTKIPGFAWLIIYFGFLIWSSISPSDRFTWWLEIAPAIIALIVLILTRNKFPLTSLLYVLVLVHCIILMIGGHYTYAEVPFFDWIRDTFDQARNNYDKLGHFAQGFIPAVLAREILIRKRVVAKADWLPFIVVSICLAFSAFYEFIEWWVAIFSGQSAEAFLGTQGYAWDTQSDMMFAMLGAVSALGLLSRYHDRQLQRLVGKDYLQKSQTRGGNA